jgi:hypothetical protein
MSKAISVLWSVVAAAAAFAIWIPTAEAYQLYSQDQNSVGNCAQCHKGFRETNLYFSHKDNENWSNSLHNIHVGDIIPSATCGWCHFGSGTSNRQVNLSSSSVAADGTNAIACSGCHGRLEDANGVTAVGTGWGAGLRQLHFNANRNIDIGGGTMVSTQVCATCHADSNPTSFTPAGEDVLPPFYDATAIDPTPLDPCNETGRGEHFEGSVVGLDNDGDLLYDTADTDCGCTTNADCDNGLFCDGAETCNTSTGDCEVGTPPTCDDGVGCTDDSCNVTTDSCDNVPNDGSCDDGFFCTGIETCDAVNDCQPGTAPDCSDGVGCTIDTCNEATDSCDNVTNDASCDDGTFCNGAETCDAVNDCQAGTPPSCDDGIGCTDDSCNVTTDSCDNAANDANCPADGQFCNGTEFCDAVADCSSTGDPCLATEVCEEVGDTCELPAACGDGNLDAGEDCDDGNTDPGDCCAPNCTLEADGSPCGDPSDGTCDDPDTCLAGACQANLELPGTPCDDQLFCNVNETCDGAGGCGGGEPNACDDGVGCTDDSCDEVGDACANDTNDASCPDDGLFCNGTEFCDAVADCSATGDPCAAGETCDEDGDTCALDATCAPVPQSTCLEATQAKLQYSEKVAGKEKAKLQWRKIAAATAQGDFGDPVAADTAATACIYDDSGSLVTGLVIDRAGQLCDGKPCWKALATKGWLYKDKLASTDGISKILFKAGDPGKGKGSVSGKNNPKKGQTALPIGVVGALTQNATPTIQLVTSDGFCVSATITEVKKDDGLQYQAQKK